MRAALLALVLALAGGAAAGEERLALDLTLRLPDGRSVRASVAPGRAFGAPAPEAVVKGPGAPELRWSVRNTDRARPAGEQAIRWAIVPEDSAAGAAPDEAVAEGVLGAELGPGERVAGSHRAPLPGPGRYVALLETHSPEGQLRQRCRLRFRVEP